MERRWKRLHMIETAVEETTYDGDGGGRDYI